MHFLTPEAGCLELLKGCTVHYVRPRAHAALSSIFLHGTIIYTKKRSCRV